MGSHKVRVYNYKDEIRFVHVQMYDFELELGPQQFVVLNNNMTPFHSCWGFPPKVSKR